MRVNGIAILGPGWQPADHRLEILRRLPRDVAGIIDSVKAGDRPDQLWYGLRNPDDEGYIDEWFDIVEAELEREGRQGESAPTLH
jgi:hypothetical protein